MRVGERFVSWPLHKVKSYNISYFPCFQIRTVLSDFIGQDAKLFHANFISYVLALSVNCLHNWFHIGECQIVMYLPLVIKKSDILMLLSPIHP